MHDSKVDAYVNVVSLVGRDKLLEPSETQADVGYFAEPN
jgi:hypothetical protein